MPNNEGWQDIHTRGQQTLAVISGHAPALTVGELTFASHETAVEALPDLSQAVKDQEEVVDDRRRERDAVIATIRDLTVRMPRKLEGEIAVSDRLHEDLTTVRAVEIDDAKSAVIPGAADGFGGEKV